MGWILEKKVLRFITQFDSPVNFMEILFSMWDAYGLDSETEISFANISPKMRSLNISFSL